MAQPPITSRILTEVAGRFQRTKAARAGGPTRVRPMDYEDLLYRSGCKDGDQRRLAELDLGAAEKQGILQIVRHRRTGLCQQVRVNPEKERELFALTGIAAPSDIRAEIQSLFQKAKTLSVPEHLKGDWLSFCEGAINSVSAGRSITPFDRGNLREINEMLTLLASLLAWNGESLIRFASSRLCGNSKRLEELQPRLETCLSKITNARIGSFADVGILPNERSIWLHGPLKLVYVDGEINLGLMRGAVRFSLSDLIRGKISTEAKRLLTVENQAMFHELCKLRSGVILVSSGSEGGFAHSAVIQFLAQIPNEVECWHFGDSDPKGFEILADLRQRSGRAINSIHMTYRPDSSSSSLTKDDISCAKRLCDSPFVSDLEKHELNAMITAGEKGNYEQESLGIPRAQWPFYLAAENA